MIIDIKLSTTKPLAWVIMLKRIQNSMTIKTPLRLALTKNLVGLRQKYLALSDKYLFCS